MGKTIKFYLIVDGQGVRTLEELRDNFNIHDVMEHYENGRLLRWLEVREYNDYAEKIRQINTSISLEEKVKLLFETFNFPSDDKNVKAAISALLYAKQREKPLKDLSNNNASKVIKDENTEYDILKKNLKANAMNLFFIKKIVDKIADNFFIEFKQDYKKFFYEIKDTHPFIVYALLMNKKIKDLLCRNLEEIIGEFSKIPTNLNNDCLKYFKRHTGDNIFHYEIITKKQVFIVSQKNVTIFESPNGVAVPQGTNFLLCNGLKAYWHYADGEIIYIEIPDTNAIN